MKNKSLLLITTIILLLTGCGSSKTTTPSQPEVQRLPTKFDYSPPSRADIGSAGTTIAIVKPTYVGQNPEYFISPFKEMAASMGNDFEELLTAKGFTVRGPFASRDEMTYNDKVNSNFILEISIELNPTYDRKLETLVNHPSLGALLLDKNAQSIYSYKVNGKISLGGHLILSAKSPQYGELLWKKSLPLESVLFTYSGHKTWDDNPTLVDELSKDNSVFNTFSIELEKFYVKALNLAWKQIDPNEMKVVAKQGKKADKRGN